MRALISGRTARLIAVLAVTAVVGVGPGSAFAAGGSDPVTTVNTETVQTYLSADGKIDSSRIYEQLTMTGDGSVTLKNPVDTNGLRNLNGFGGLSPKNGVLEQHYDVNGVSQGRTVSTFDQSKLPLSVTVRYQLDGRTVSADDLVGATGDVKVTYVVKNLTTKKIPLTFTDGAGGTKTEMGDVPIPIVGTVVFNLPKNFTDVQSVAASMGGDGHGGTQMQYLLSLFPPVGSDTVSFGYTAHLTDGVVPPVSFTAVPVDPTTNPTFSTAVDSYQSGAESGDTLAAGATKINKNLLRLRDGAGTLLAGLIKLNDGAHQLDAGLSGQAAPGSRQLSDGALQLNSGLARIDDGAGRLAVGAHEASDGGHKLAAGLTELHSALVHLPNTLAHNKKYQLLLGALTQIANGVGNVNDPPTKKTILGGLNAIQQGLEVSGPNDCLTATILGFEPTNCGAIDAVKALASSVAQSRGQDLRDTPIVLGKVSIVTEGLLMKKLADIGATAGCQSDAACVKDVGDLSMLFDATKPGDLFDQQLALLQTSLTTIGQKADEQLLNPGAGLDQLRAGLSNPHALKDCAAAARTKTTADDCGIKEAALAVQGGVPLLVDSLRQEILAGLGTPSPGCDPTKTLRCGAAALADGLGQLDGGSHQLADGTSQALDGSAQLADGAHQLSDGLSSAAAGSHQLAEGMQQARDGAPKLRNGANELSERGVVKIVDAGQQTAQQYGKLYATLTAGAKRAHTDGMIYGAPADSMGLMAYDFEINGTSGQGSRDVTRALLAVVFGGLGLGAFALRRRSVKFLPGA
jgi:putative membrane protein